MFAVSCVLCVCWCVVWRMLRGCCLLSCVVCGLLMFVVWCVVCVVSCCLLFGVWCVLYFGMLAW